ncbi:MAG: hypothetical protein GF317_10875 [Candidatus Lokiarchaeota archaeon]|nr:hypothetical protein [Candidatus Lokiarchaeota archaeon]MBD3200165.1 hypothetical protein [Candidatus Lokiarchaeota archaeon]
MDIHNKTAEKKIKVLLGIIVLTFSILYLTVAPIIGRQAGIVLLPALFIVGWYFKPYIAFILDLSLLPVLTIIKIFLLGTEIAFQFFDIQLILYSIGFSLIGIVASFISMGVEKLNLEIKIRKQVEEELLNQRNELSNFAHTMNHDIRNRLMRIQMHAEMIELNPEKLSTSIKIINNQVEQITKFLEKSVQLADSGKIVDDKKQVDLNDIVEETAKVVLSSEINLQKDQLPIVLADKMKLFQVFKNLFENAILHGKTTSTIKVLYSCNQVHHKIIIENNGEKISRAIRDKLFDKRGFFRDRILFTQNHMGLFIIARIVQALGWDIKFNDDKAVGFTILIPIEVK